MLHNVYSNIKDSAIRVLYCVMLIVRLQTPPPALQPVPTLSPGLRAGRALGGPSAQAYVRVAEASRGEAICPRPRTGKLSPESLPASGTGIEPFS